MDLGSVLPPKIVNFEANDKTSGLLMTMGEFFNFRAKDRKLNKQEGDDYFMHQRIVRQYMVYNDHLLVVHDAGTGKTRTTLGFLHELVNGPLKGIYKRVVIATPSELLHENWKNNPEVNMFAGKISIEYTTHSRLSRYNPENYPGTFFVMDEAHIATGDSIDISFDRLDKENLRNVRESRSKDDIYRGIWNILHNAPLHKVLLLTATPMQNSQGDFYPLINFILPLEDQIMSYGENISDEKMLTLLSGRVSYVRSAEEGVDVRYGLSSNMLQSLNVSRLLNGVGKFNLGYLFDIQLGKTYAIPGYKNVPHSHLMMELRNQEIVEFSLIIDLSNLMVVWSEPEDYSGIIEFQIQMGETGPLINFQKVNLPSGTMLGDLDFVFSVPSTLNNKIYPKEDHEIGVVETFLSASQTLMFTSRLDEIRNKPLEEKGLSISNTKLVVIDDLVKGLTPETMYHISNLYSTIILTFLLSLPKEAREGHIKPVWREFIGDETVETGKNILFSEYVESNVGGIEKIGQLISRIGYSQFKFSDTNKMDLISYGKAPRFILNPTPREIEMFNHPENWDGSYIQVSLYSSQGAKGVSYFDVRHIHLIPHWSPSENTQALYRGIRAKSHDNLRSRIPAGEPLEVRVYKHVSTPLLSLCTYNNQWVVEGVKVSPDLRYFGEAEDQESYIPTSQLPTTLPEMIHYENTLNEYTRVLAKEASENATLTDPFIDFQFTIHGFSMQYVPNPTNHPNTDITGSNLKLPAREGFPVEINETFYSPVTYKLTLATRKDIDIARIRLLYKQAAMDCDLNKSRNVLPDALDNTEWCEYVSCDYECLPGIRGLEIVIDTIDPTTGEDVRWERDPWAPLTQARLATGDIYSVLTESLKTKLLQYTVETISSNPLGYVQLYRLVLGLKERFGTLVSEPQYLSFISNLIYSNESSRYITDKYKNFCTLKTQGSVVYLCPLYVSERKLYFTPEGQVASRFLHGSTQRLFSNQGSWSKISSPPPGTNALKEEYENFIRSRSPGEEMDEIFRLAGDFEKFVRIIEGSYLTSLERGNPNVISQRFSKYFMTTTLDRVDKIMDSRGNLSTPTVSPWKIPNKDRVTVHFHLLYHMHPSLGEVRKTLSENAPIRMLISTDVELGFMETTPVEQKILYGIAEETDKNRLLQLSEKSRMSGKEGIIGIVDDKKFIDPVGKDKLEYFKIYVPLSGKPSVKHPQGKVCSSYTDADLKNMISIFGLEPKTGKMETCKALYEKFRSDNLVS
jgi:hypothetical protein